MAQGTCIGMGTVAYRVAGTGSYRGAYQTLFGQFDGK